MTLLNKIIKEPKYSIDRSKQTDSSYKIQRYDVPINTYTSNTIDIDFSLNMDYVSNGDTTDTITITFSNLPSSNRGQVVVLTMIGATASSTIIWPDNAVFMNKDGLPPVPIETFISSSNVMMFTLKWNGQNVQVFHKSNV